MVVVGRHPACDTRLDSLRVSRHHCCMSQENGEVMVRDLGSTNGIRINGQGWRWAGLRPGDELSIAHIRYRLENGQGHEQTIAEPVSPGRWVRGRSRADRVKSRGASRRIVGPVAEMRLPSVSRGENVFAAAVRKLLPNGVADKCRIQVIVQMAGDQRPGEEDPGPWCQNHASENAAECHSDIVPLFKGTAPTDRPATAGPLDRPAPGL